MHEKYSKRRVRMSLNFSPSEREELKVGADIAGLRPNSYFLRLHREGAIITERNTLDDRGLRALTTFTNNFNQLTKKVNKLSETQLSNAKTLGLIADYLSKILTSGKSIQEIISERKDKEEKKEKLLGLITRLEIQLQNSEKTNAELRKMLSSALRRLGC